MDDIKPKHVLCFAHRGEAKAFIKRWNLKGSGEKALSGVWSTQAKQLAGDKQPPDVWILGEGIESAGIRLSYLLGRFPEVNSVINLGVAGFVLGGVVPKGFSLPEIGSLVQIRTSYGMHYDQKVRFKSYTNENLLEELPVFDCFSIGRRLTQANEYLYVSGFAAIVDMELWGLHAAAASAGCKLESIKVVSDVVDPNRAIPENLCSLVKSKSDELSELLWQAWTTWEDSRKKPTSRSELPKDFAEQLNSEFPQRFWLSSYQKNELGKHLRALSISKSLEPEELNSIVLKWIRKSQIDHIKGPAKKRGGVLSDRLKEMIYAEGAFGAR